MATLKAKMDTEVELVARSAKYCSNCRQHKFRFEGVYKTFAGGLRQRWICAECAKKGVKHATKVNVSK